MLIADIATKEVLSAVSDSTAPEDTQEKASIGSKTSLSSEEKLRLLAQYDCQSDEETEASAYVSSVVSEGGHYKEILTQLSNSTVTLNRVIRI